jgi:hypothetical protein
MVILLISLAFEIHFSKGQSDTIILIALSWGQALVIRFFIILMQINGGEFVVICHGV